MNKQRSVVRDLMGEDLEIRNTDIRGRENVICKKLWFRVKRRSRRLNIIKRYMIQKAVFDDF